jgi:hypothetical protein
MSAGGDVATCVGGRTGLVEWPRGATSGVRVCLNVTPRPSPRVGARLHREGSGSESHWIPKLDSNIAHWSITENHRIHLVLFGMHDRTLGSFLAASNRILISVMERGWAG